MGWLAYAAIFAAFTRAMLRAGTRERASLLGWTFVWHLAAFLAFYSVYETRLF